MTSTSTSFEPYGHDLTTLARQNGFLPRRQAYETEIARIFQVLQRPAKHSVAVVDLGSGTSRQVALEVIRRMATGEVPEALCAFRAVAVDCDALVAGIPDLESAKEVHADFLSGKRGTPLPEENEENEEDLLLQLGHLPDGMEHAEHVVSSLLGGKGGWTWLVKDDPLQRPLIEFFQTLRQHHEEASSSNTLRRWGIQTGKGTCDSHHCFLH
jgi:hypothetical protein